MQLLMSSTGWYWVVFSIVFLLYALSCKGPAMKSAAWCD